MSDGINLVDLTPLLAPHWDWFFYPAYVIHKGLVKTQGIIINDEGAVSLTMFTGLPAEIRPASSVSVPLFADELDTEWVHAMAPFPGSLRPGQYAKGYLPISLASTVHPDGTWTLDTLPSEALAGTSPFFIAIMVNASWPVATSSDTIPATEPLGPYLDPLQFTDIDSGICLHGNWVHLTGRILAVESGAGANFFSILARRLPQKYRPDQPNSSSPTGQFNFANTFATAPCGRAAVQVFNDNLDMAFEPYSLAQSGNPYSGPIIPGLMQGRGGLDDTPPFESHPAGFPYQAAASCPNEVAAGGFVPQNTDTRWGFPTCFIDCGGLAFAFGWVAKNNEFVPFLGPVPDADLRGTINAFARAPDWVLILAGAVTSQAWGAHQIATEDQCGQPEYAGSPGVCYLNTTGQGPDSPAGYTRYFADPQLGGTLTTVTFATDVASRQLDVGYARDDITPVSWPFGYLGQGVGWADHHGGRDGWSPQVNDQAWLAVISPPTRQYDTYGPGTTSFMDYLWRPDLAPNTGSTTFGGGNCTGLDEIVDWVVVPYYETSRHYVKAGDEVSFEGAGYASRAKGALMSLT